jgi:hypothetical protein
MDTPYPVSPENWPSTPIVRDLNPKTAEPGNEAGLREGDDHGYRKIATRKDVHEPLVQPADVAFTRPSYDGFDEYGNSFDQNIVLAGGLPGGKLVVREEVARGLDRAQEMLTQFFAGDFNVVAIDGFRSRDRQAAGFTRIMMRDVLQGKEPEGITELYRAGKIADDTFAWVNADVNADEYKALAAELLAKPEIKQELESLAGEGEITQDVLDEIVYEVITISANSNRGPAAGRKVPLVFENNAHAGGGAIDMMLADGQGRILNPVPFDFVGPEAAMDYLESDENCDALIRRIQSEPDSILGQHFKKIGMSATMKDLTVLREALRVAYHLMKSIGATYYSAHDPKGGGENWHMEPGNVVFNLDGSVYHRAPSAAENFDSGNPGHALQKHGRDATAVWGGATGHASAIKDHGLEIEL